MALPVDHPLAQTLIGGTRTATPCPHDECPGTLTQWSNDTDSDDDSEAPTYRICPHCQTTPDGRLVESIVFDGDGGMDRPTYSDDTTVVQDGAVPLWTRQVTWFDISDAEKSGGVLAVQ